MRLARQAERPVFCTCGDEGMLLADPEHIGGTPLRIAGYPVDGPTDPVGAGDSTAPALCAPAAGRRWNRRRRSAVSWRRSPSSKSARPARRRRTR